MVCKTDRGMRKLVLLRARPNMQASTDTNLKCCAATAAADDATVTEPSSSALAAPLHVVSNGAARAGSAKLLAIA